MRAGRAEADGFNRLVLGVGLSWREVSVLRAAYRYLRQAGVTPNQRLVEQVLLRFPDVCRLLIDLFGFRLDPQLYDDARAEAARAELDAAVDAVESADDDRIVRAFVRFIDATVRTNFFAGDVPLSFKLDPARLPFLPHPRPLVETFVYAPAVEGLHLRAARVARGGVRWSERSEDYRTEVLALMRAQSVKNAVIVPEGAKGAFVIRSEAPSRADPAICYRTFITGLLAITDNLIDGRAVTPERVVARDGPDPYLVVAADKGDGRVVRPGQRGVRAQAVLAGGRVRLRWRQRLRPKAMGITARGAWMSLRHHLARLGIDVETDEFTVVGIGDMSGDVFGNGMLLSPHLRLVAAFDHRHVFLDPDPDPVTSFAERQRLFELPRSSWADYDRALLSPGGGVFRRTVKTVALAPQVRRRLGIQATPLPVPALISALLRAPVDVLWNGGIGTYVKARTETNADAADRANDQLRVDAADLRCRVVVEGGNLGFTQPARIEYALHGGLINTDFIDNSAGVNTSDHEVNLKILAAAAVAAGDLPAADRNPLLAALRPEVTQAVLADAAAQVRALTVTEAHSALVLDQHARLIERIQEQSIADTQRDVLPTPDLLNQRRTGGYGLTRPEIALLLALSKNRVQSQLLDTTLPDEASFTAYLADYFPSRARQRLGARLSEHPLRREIVAMRLANEVINDVGPGFFHRIEERTGAAVADTLPRYLVVRDVFRLQELTHSVTEQVTAAAVPALGTLCHQMQRFAEQATLWLLRRRTPAIDWRGLVGRYEPSARRLTDVLASVLTPAQAQHLADRVGELAGSGLSRDATEQAVGLGLLSPGLDLIDLALRTGTDIELAARVHFAISEALDIDLLLVHISEEPGESHWHLLAKAGLREDLVEQRARLTAAALQAAAAGAAATDADELVGQWLAESAREVEHYRQTLLRFYTEDVRPDLAMLAVAVAEVRALSSGSTWPRRRRPAVLS